MYKLPLPLSAHRIGKVAIPRPSRGRKGAGCAAELPASSYRRGMWGRPLWNTRPPNGDHGATCLLTAADNWRRTSLAGLLFGVAALGSSPSQPRTINCPGRWRRFIRQIEPRLWIGVADKLHPSPGPASLVEFVTTSICSQSLIRKCYDEFRLGALDGRRISLGRACVAH